MSKAEKYDRGSPAKRRESAVWCECGRLCGGKSCKCSKQKCAMCGKMLGMAETIAYDGKRVVCMLCNAQKRGRR